MNPWHHPAVYITGPTCGGAGCARYIEPWAISGTYIATQNRTLGRTRQDPWETYREEGNET